MQDITILCWIRTQPDTIFAHPMVKDNLTLSSPDKETRDFWINHCKQCIKISSHLLFNEKIVLHITRPVRWDSDHVIHFDDETLIDIVQFNCGHWDTARWSGYDVCLTSEAEYARNIKMVIDLIKQKFINAKIIFATTTTMNPDNLPCLNFRDNSIIDRYNEIAVEIAEDNGVYISDLNKITRSWPGEYYRDYCHFTDKASSILGKAIADKMQSVLSCCE